MERKSGDQDVMVKLSRSKTRGSAGNGLWHGGSRVMSPVSQGQQRPSLQCVTARWRKPPGSWAGTVITGKRARRCYQRYARLIFQPGVRRGSSLPMTGKWDDDSSLYRLSPVIISRKLLHRRGTEPMGTTAPSLTSRGVRLE